MTVVTQPRLTNQYDFSKLKDFEIKWKDVSNYVAGRTGQTKIPTRGYTTFYVAGTQIPKSIVIFVYGEKTKTEYGQIDNVNFLEFYKGEYDVRSSLGALAQYFTATNLSSCEEVMIFCPCYNPFDSDDNLQLYDEYNYAFTPTSNNLSLYHQVQDRIRNQTNVRQEYFACRKYIPTNAPFIHADDSIDNPYVSNLVTDGNFTNASLNLPLKYANNATYRIENGQIRDLITPITSNMYYNFYSVEDFYGYQKMGDFLRIVPFTTFDDDYYKIESLPKNYLQINGVVKDSTFTPEFKSLTIRLEGASAIRNKSLVVSFYGIDQDLTLNPSINIEIWWREFNGVSFNNYGKFNIDPIILTDKWTKYTRVVKQPKQNDEVISASQNTFVEIQLRFPRNVPFLAGITNVFIDYGTQEVAYPRNSLKDLILGNSRNLISANYSPTQILERAGNVVARMIPDDTETTILADGRVIFKDDVYEFNEVDSLGNIVGNTISIPYSKTNGRGLYDLIVKSGYPDGNGDDHFSCDSLHNPTWEDDATASVIDNIFYWNYIGFKPVCDFTTGNGAGKIFNAIERHRSQTLDDGLAFKTFIQKNDNSKIWYGCQTINYLSEFVKNSGELRTKIACIAPSFSGSTYGYMYADTAINSGGASMSINGSFRTKSQGVLCFPVTQTLASFNDASTDGDLSKTTKFGKNYGIIDTEKTGVKESLPFSYSNNFASYTTDPLNELINNNLVIMGYVNPLNFISSTYNPASLSLFNTKGDFPTISDSYKITPNSQHYNESYRNTCIANDTGIKVYYKNDQDSTFTPVGTNQHLKRIRLPLFIRNVAFYEITLTGGDDYRNYKGGWFYAESKATRTYKIRHFINGNTQVETTAPVDDNKFCFYFQTGGDLPPTTLPFGTMFIPININTARNKNEISNIIQEAVNSSYRVKIPNLQNSILKSSGISDFENKIQNQVDGFVDEDYTNMIVCNNFRNAGNKIPQNFMIERHFVNGGSGTGYGYEVYAPANNSVPYNTAVINFHVSLV